MIRNTIFFHLCNRFGEILIESLESKMKSECNITNIVAYCGHSTRKRLFIADSTSLYEFSLDWLSGNRLESILESSSMPADLNDAKDELFTFKKYNANQTSLSTSSSSLNSSNSCSSSTTRSTTTSSISNGISKGTYTALCFDVHTNKLLAAKCDKVKTVIEIYNSDNYSYEYCIDTNKNEKPLKRITSMSCTNEGLVVCTDLLQNSVKMFRFI